MRESRQFELIYQDAGKKRLDQFLSEQLGQTRSFLQTVIKAGQVSINERLEKKAGYFLEQGDRITGSFEPPLTSSHQLEPEEIDLKIVYEDDHVIVINKPAGMVVHPTPQLRTGTLVNALLSRYQKLSDCSGEPFRPGIVHRLDKDTSGLMLVAKTNLAHQSLSKQLAGRTLKRVYWAIVLGKMPADDGTVDAPIGRHPKDRKKMSVLTGEGQRARHAVTHWKVLKPIGKNTLLELRLETGRTHQIRVHMSHIGHPILGDLVYGGKAAASPHFTRHCLHAKKITYLDPVSGEFRDFEVEENCFSGLSHI
ncbi:MAG: RluA family pseudouridine synthase [Candidatus Caenarcaniphilales bacterium]|nr:RluA family pseudouridine synthase [Candidatus Caenarcaniphilales bacterium]